MTSSSPRKHFSFSLLIAGLALTLGTAACKGKPTIQDGSAVKIHYTLTVDGQTVDSSRQGEPLAFTVGAGHIIPGLEEQLKGLSVGDKRSIVVTPEKGYGPIHPEAIQKVPKNKFHGVDKVKVGTTVTAQNNGRMLQARVVEVNKDSVTVDLNHPMAGKTLNFDIEVMDVAKGEKDAKTEGTGS